MHSTTEPSIKKLVPAFAAKKRTACTGLTASSTAGSRRIQGMPRQPMTANQSSMKGPKIAPMLAAAQALDENSETRIRSAIGITAGAARA